MEQTLGKRIAAQRKKLGLTQDQLAERLGVTAQAVSKWENDQSCPDITTLPRLAEIFGTSTDALLGHNPPPVYTAEVVTDDEQESEGIHIEKGGIAVNWHAGRMGGVFFSVFVLLVGVLTLLDTYFSWGVGFWSICWPSFLLVMGIFTFTKRFSFFGLGCSIFGLYFLISNLGIWRLELSSKLIFPAILVVVGLSLLADALRKPKKPHITFKHKGNSAKTQRNCTVNGEHAECSLSFGEDHQRLDMARLSSCDIDCSFGELTVDLCGCKEIANGCHVDADCSFGEIHILVPRHCRVELSADSSFGSVDIQGSPEPNADTVLYLDADASFGEINVRYV